MVRRFDTRPVPRAVLDRVLDSGRRAPSAGHSQGWAFVVLESPAQTATYWDATLPPEEREEFPWPSLLRVPVLVVPLAHAATYVERYAEPDKAGAGLGDSAAGWPVPYWTVDTAFATMLMLLAAVDEGLGALFFGVPGDPGRVDAMLGAFGVPAGYEPIGTVALGWPAPDDRPSGSATTRRRRALDEVVHRGRW